MKLGRTRVRQALLNRRILLMVTGALILVLLASSGVFGPSSDQELLNSSNPADFTSKEIEGYKISIDKIGVEAPIIAVGREENGDMAAPTNGYDVGWFEPGTKPGGQGNAVLAGHVNYDNADGVFAQLDQLNAGDTVTVTETDGRELHFEVTGKQAYKPGNDASAQIFGASDGSKLNLITCTGEWDPKANSYTDRLVVFTELKN